LTCGKKGVFAVPEMRISEIGGVSVVLLSGVLRIPYDWSEPVVPLLERGDRVVLDLTKVVYIDSHGMGEFMRVLNKGMDNEGLLVISGASVRLKELLRVTGIDRIVKIFDSKESALDAFG
jgi:anti-anti-sigma factor